MSIKVKPTDSGYYEYAETFYSLTGEVGFVDTDLIFCFDVVHRNYVVLRAFDMVQGDDESITVVSLFEIYQRGWDDRTIYSFGEIASAFNPRAREDGLIEFSPKYDGVIDIMGGSLTDPYDFSATGQFFKNVKIATEICNDMMKQEADSTYTPKHSFKPIKAQTVYLHEGLNLPVS